MKRTELKKRVRDVIDAGASRILDFGTRMFEHPELGFKEVRTAETAAEFLRSLGLPTEEGLAITGVKARLEGSGGKERPSVALLGELDAVVCPEHPHADPATSAAHACGHNVQVAGLLGAALGLVESGIADRLDGSVVFMAVPAEEFVEIGYRLSLKEKGDIEFLGGKQEWIRLGHFDDVDMAMMFHALSGDEIRHVQMSGSSNGFVGKTVVFHGKEAHAGGAPERGINALDAAMLGLMGIHAQRSTFKDSDNIRVHPILTHGGDLVNIVPARATIETYVRANNVEAMRETAMKVDRAMRAGADAVGANVTITTVPGYLPCVADPGLSDVFAINALSLLGGDHVYPARHESFSTDMGDVMHLMPGIHAFVGGVAGAMHSKNFAVKDPEFAYLTAAKLMAYTVIDLLADGAESARRILKNHQPLLTKEEYLGFLRSFAQVERHPAS